MATSRENFGSAMPKGSGSYRARLRTAVCLLVRRWKENDGPFKHGFLEIAGLFFTPVLDSRQILKGVFCKKRVLR